MPARPNPDISPLAFVALSLAAFGSGISQRVADPLLPRFALEFGVSLGAASWIVGARGRLPRLGRWKMLENLRRSLHAPASMALLVSAWAMPAANPGIWLIVVLLPAAMPAIINSVARLAGQCATDTLVTNVRQLVIELIEDLARALAGLALLAQSAWLSADAISRALWRLLVSHRRLLQWVTAAQSKAQSNQALRSFVWSMRGAQRVPPAQGASALLPPRSIVRACVGAVLACVSVAHADEVPWLNERIEVTATRVPEPLKTSSIRCWKWLPLME